MAKKNRRRVQVWNKKWKTLLSLRGKVGHSNVQKNLNHPEAMSSPEGQKLIAALLADEGKFIDHSHSSAFIVQEHEL